MKRVLLTAIFGILTLASCLRAQPADQGGAYVTWDPLYPQPAYDTYEWTITVTALSDPNSYYYWALQNGFTGGGTFYMGIQPYGSCGITNAGNCKIALFSFFGNGATPTSPNCAPGADGGPGAQCRISYSWVMGRPYKLTATLTANDGTLETWTGYVTDVTTGVGTTIGSWAIPASDGLIGTQGVSFTEYYEPYNGGCGAEPYAEVIWNAPIGYAKGTAYPGSVRGTAPTPGCPTNSAFTTETNSITVQTGGSLGPVILGVQDAESVRTSVVPGEWAAIYGQNLSGSTRTWNSGDFVNGNALPISLDGVSVQFGGVAAPVYFVSPAQLDVQVPGGLSGTVPVTVTFGNAQSAAFLATVVPSAPSLFVYSAGSLSYAAATHADGSLIGDPSMTPNSTPASAGETIILYVNGLQSSPSGVVISAASPVSDATTVTIGKLPASIQYQGLVGTGQFQVNVIVPSAGMLGIPASVTAPFPIAISANGIVSPAGVMLPVKGNQPE